MDPPESTQGGKKRQQRRSRGGNTRQQRRSRGVRVHCSTVELTLIFTICFAMVTLLKLHSLARNSVSDHNGKIDQLTAFLSINNNSKDTVDIRMNAIQYENQLSGSPEWILSSPAMNREVEGFMSNSSINKGQSIKLFYSVNEPNLPKDTMVSLEVFRTGWYQGIGGRKLLGPINVPPIAQEIPSFQKDGLLVCKWKDPFILNTE